MKYFKYMYVAFFTFLLTFGSVNLYYTGNLGLNYEGYQHRIYLNALEDGYDGDYASWLDSISGKDASEIIFRVEGNYIEWKYESEPESSWRLLINTLDLVGLTGEDGENGHTPYIGENGHWWIDQVDTQVPAFYTATDGDNGLTPYIGSNGHWFIGNTDTNVLAEAMTGDNGKDGVGIKNIEFISTLDGVDSYLISFTNDTSFTYTITNGTNGKDGITPHIGDNGHWFIGLIDTGIVAKAVDGKNGRTAFETFLIYYPEYEGDEEDWIYDLINGNLKIKIFHTVSFQTDGGTQIASQTIENGKKATQPEIPVKEGYEFVNWLYQGERWVFIGYVVTEDMVLIADWQENFTGPIPLNPQNLTNVQSVNDFWSIPSLGTPKILVVPVEFPDVRFSNPATVTQNIETTINGSSSSTFQSLNSFYQTSSFDKLDLTGEVLQPFLTANNSSFYQNVSNFNGVTSIINEIMAAYNSEINFSDYDYNNDGNLDGIFLIYSKTNGTWGSFWWAYLSSYSGSTRYDGIIPTAYVWMPYNFVLVNNELESRTLIHEAGHMLGLEDYYDYDEEDGSNNEYGLGGADMMDNSVGDHNPWSKLILGWIEPLVVTETMSYDLMPYITTGQALIITDQWNGTLFDEYIIAMYFTNEGFYKDVDFYFDSQPGLVLYHVDARIGQTAKVNSSYPSTPFINNNTDTPNKLIKFIEADGNNSLASTGFVWDLDVYRPGHTFNGNRNANYAWHQTSRGKVKFTITFVEEINGKISLEFIYAS